MQIEIQPAAFHVQHAQVPGPDGTLIDIVRVVIVDQGGTQIATTFSPRDFEAFQRYVADPVGEQARQAARAKIQLAPDIRAIRPEPGRKH